jgi:hypothetical protein
VLWNDYSYTAKADPESLYRWYVDRVPDGVMNDRFAEISPWAAMTWSSSAGRSATSPRRSTSASGTLSASPRSRRRRVGNGRNARPIGSSWVYNREESDAGTYSSAAQLVREIVDVVAHTALGDQSLAELVQPGESRERVADDIPLEGRGGGSTSHRWRAGA